MATNSGRINFEVGFTVDRSGLNEIQNSLQQTMQALNSQTSDLGVGEMRNQILQLQGILNSSWNNKLGQLDMSKFNEQLARTGLTAEGLRDTFSRIGESGARSWNLLQSSIINTTAPLKEHNKVLNSIAQTLTNSLRWNLASSAVNNLTNSIQSAWNFTVKLDSSLNDIRIVTNKSAEEMERFATQANKAAQNLGASTRDYTDASLLYFQQGLSDNEVTARTETTLKAANVTGQSTSAVSEQLTAVWNGYKVTAEETEEYVDRLAAVAAHTASNLEELSTGMSKVASSAAALGVSEEQLAAQMSTIISITRQAPESVGTALKTIYARMTDIETGVEENGVTLGNYSGEMAQMGISVLDTAGNLRDMGEVIEEVGSKWSGFSREQQIALAQTMAGTRLFKNWRAYMVTYSVAA